MGVVGTFCQICGVAVQHDHYVPMNGMFGIYRGGADYEVCAPLVTFGPEHAWLKRAVGLRLDAGQEPALIEGEVHDGRFDGKQPGGMVWDGLDERAALHRACWELAGRPDSWRALKGRIGETGLKPYQEQLFDFARLLEDGGAWLLVDPDSGGEEGRRNRERIFALLG